MKVFSSKKVLTILLTSFVCIELALLLLILWGSSNLLNIFEFSSIAFCFVFSLFFVSKMPIIILTQVALLCTMIADFSLEIIKPMNQPVAMTFFLFAQLCYFARLLVELKTKKWRIINVVLRIVLVIFAEIVALIILKNNFDYLSLVAICYFILSLSNITLAFSLFKTSPLFALGLLFFLCCDVFIGLQCAVGVYIDLPPESIIYKIIFMPFNIAWLFYLPSQVLISTSLVSKVYTKNMNR